MFLLPYIHLSEAAVTSSDVSKFSQLLGEESYRKYSQLVPPTNTPLLKMIPVKLLNFWRILVLISIQPLRYLSHLNVDVNDVQLFTESYIRLKWKEC